MRFLIIALICLGLDNSAVAQGITPDSFKLIADGTDDAPSVQRAINALCSGSGGELRLLPRHYTMNTPVTQSCAVSWIGQGWQENVITSAALLGGTWLDFGIGAFGPGGLGAAVRFSGAAAAGTRVQNLGATQPFTLPASTDTTWTPQDTGPIFFADGLNGGIEFADIMCRGVNKCIHSVVSGRSVFNRVYGQAWRQLIFIDKSYDSSRFDEIHLWPYVSSDYRVMNFTQANSVALLTQRSDTPLIGRMFAFGALAGIIFDTSAAAGPSLPGGTTTGASIDSLSCDFVKYCIFIASSGAQFQLGQLRSYSQRWPQPTDPATPPVMLAGSAVMAIAGNVIAQMGNVQNFGSDTAIFRYLSTTVPSNMQISSLYAMLGYMSVNAVLSQMETVVGESYHVLTLGMPPMLTPDAPLGFTIKNAGTDGLVSWPNVVPR